MNTDECRCKVDRPAGAIEGTTESGGGIEAQGQKGQRDGTGSLLWMGTRTRRVCGGFPVKKNRFLTGAALLVAVDENPTGLFVRCDIADLVEQMVSRGAPPRDLRPRLVFGVHAGGLRLRFVMRVHPGACVSGSLGAVGAVLRGDMNEPYRLGTNAR